MESFTQKETSTNLNNNTARRIVGVIFGLIEIILAFRLIFKLLGADPQSGFVQLIYNITQFFVGFFEGIFAKAATGNQAVFEPATLIAMIVVALVAWLVLTLITSNRNRQIERTETTNGNLRSTTPPTYTTQQQVPPTYTTQQQVPPTYTTQQQVVPPTNPNQQQVPPTYSNQQQVVQPTYPNQQEPLPTDQTINPNQPPR